MKRINILALLTATVIFVASCSEKPDIENTSTYKMSGEWFVELKVAGAPVAGFHKIITYNTSDPNSGKIWLNDLNYWPFKGKLDVDYGALSFKAAATVSNDAEPGETINVIEGKVFPGVGHSKSGNLVDSFYLKVEFSDDPGTQYEYGGHQRTGFFEDEY